MFWQTLNHHEVLRWAGIFLAIGFLTWLGIGLLRRWLLHHNLLAVPNDRSSHDQPTPHGAGAVMITIILLCWLGLIIKHQVPLIYYGVLASTAMLAALSWLDDHGHVPFLRRLMVHGIAATIAVISLPDSAVIFGDWLPLWLERTMMAFGLVWFMNLYNFMDGIDGMMGSLTATIAVGIAIITPLWLDWQLSLVIIPVAIGFLCWNWMPAKIFSGDVGSVALGYLIGWLLLRLALSGYPVSAVILAAYPIADTTFTLLRRISQGERFWIPHRNHFFQKAVRSGLSHAAVTGGILLLQILMVALAVWATHRRMSPIILCIIFVTTWLSFFQWRFRYSVAHQDGREGSANPARPVLSEPVHAADKQDEK
ncbi:MAG TPA: glycosyl transferase [Rhodospirillaceae bacterium]|nr:glycosyl transferase [Rhodospirillaceae bacterium]